MIRCDKENPKGYGRPCIRARGHEGDHRSILGDIWAWSAMEPPVLAEVDAIMADASRIPVLEARILELEGSVARLEGFLRVAQIAIQQGDTELAAAQEYSDKLEGQLDELQAVNRALQRGIDIVPFTFEISDAIRVANDRVLDLLAENKKLKSKLKAVKQAMKG